MADLKCPKCGSRRIRITARQSKRADFKRAQDMYSCVDCKNVFLEGDMREPKPVAEIAEGQVKKGGINQPPKTPKKAIKPPAQSRP